MDYIELKNYLDKHSEYQSYLYVRGFCITDENLDLTNYPFYGNWSKLTVDGSNIAVYVESRKSIYLYKSNEKTYFLIGHAYDPFNNRIHESDILKHLAASDDFWESVNDLTGVFCIGWIEGEHVHFTCDAAGQQLLYYGTIKNKIFITSHAKMVADLYEIEQDEYITRLINYKFYHFFGTVLPGDLSPYKELKRCQCNFATHISTNSVELKRFWPTEKIRTCKTEAEYNKVISDIASILSNNMKLISEKWTEPKAAISVTGGMDSKTTMACTNGLYDKFQYFSYDSLPDEKIDADAAKLLCTKLGVNHKTYFIPVDDSTYPDFDIMREIFSFNIGGIGYNNRNDVRKRLFFLQINDFDLEVKSWVDEIGRARYHKRYRKSSFPKKPTARYLTSFYKAFLHNRKLVRDTDKVFEQYMKTYWSEETLSNIPWWDLFYWEFEWNAAEGIFLTGELNFAYDTTIPFNNRRLLELMLRVPLKKRITDDIQHDVIRKMNKAIEESGIHVNDVSHTDNRARLERAYLEINTRLPF